MPKLLKLAGLVICIYLLSFNTAVNANEVQILSADFHNNNASTWSVSVTLKHDDKGWDHYADIWRIVSEKGDMLGKRVLYHPHVSEQPFTRSLAGIRVPEGINIVFIEAHDKVHGWSAARLKVDLTKAVDGRLTVDAK